MRQPRASPAAEAESPSAREWLTQAASNFAAENPSWRSEVALSAMPRSAEPGNDSAATIDSGASAVSGGLDTLRSIRWKEDIAKVSRVGG